MLRFEAGIGTNLRNHVQWWLTYSGPTACWIVIPCAAVLYMSRLAYSILYSYASSAGTRSCLGSALSGKSALDQQALSQASMCLGSMHLAHSPPSPWSGRRVSACTLLPSSCCSSRGHLYVVFWSLSIWCCCACPWCCSPDFSNSTAVLGTGQVPMLF